MSCSPPSGYPQNEEGFEKTERDLKRFFPPVFYMTCPGLGGYMGNRMPKGRILESNFLDGFGGY